MLLPCSVFICFETEHIKKEKKIQSLLGGSGEDGGHLGTPNFH